MIDLAFPEIKRVADLIVTEPEVHSLDNGINIYGFNGAVNEVIKLELIFSAGRWTEYRPLSAAATAALLKSGSESETAYELEGKIDLLGSTIKASAGYNGFTLSLYCMTRHLESSLQILNRILHQSVFPQEELDLYKVNSQSRLKVNMRKNDYVGDMIFKEMLFGPEHPYGYMTTAERIGGLDRDALKTYYIKNLTMGNCLIGLAGNYKPGDIDLLNKYLGQTERWSDKSSSTETREWQLETSESKRKIEHLKDSVQASIYIGVPSIRRTHEDYHALSFLNLIFGGYFGSRLMKNIREEKGMTYGIYSYIQQYKNAAAFIINTETALEYADDCLDEIYAEMERLRHQPIGDQELGKARNYMMGRLLDQVDGPFKSADTFLSLKSHDIPLSYVKETVRAIGELNAGVLTEMAQKYFEKEVMYEVVVK